MLHLLQLLLKLPLALLHALSHGGLSFGPMIILIEITFLQFSILVLKILDLLLHHLDGDILGLQLLLDEDVIHLVPLLHNHEVIVRMGQLADVVLELH